MTGRLVGRSATNLFTALLLYAGFQREPTYRRSTSLATSKEEQSRSSLLTGRTCRRPLPISGQWQNAQRLNFPHICCTAGIVRTLVNNAQVRSGHELLELSPLLTLTTVERTDAGWTVVASDPDQLPCPRCRQLSTSRHSRYVRTLTDVPAFGAAVSLRVCVGRWCYRQSGRTVGFHRDIAGCHRRSIAAGPARHTLPAA
jgi:hypothetical protein